MIDLLKFSLKPPIFAVENSRYLLYFEFFPVLYFGGDRLAGLYIQKIIDLPYLLLTYDYRMDLRGI